MRPSEDCNCAPGLKKFTQRVGRLRSLREGADKYYVDVCRQLIYEVLEAGVAYERPIMSFFLAPYPEDLRHDAGKVGVHHACEQRPRGSLCDKVYDADPKFTNTSLLSIMNQRNTLCDLLRKGAIGEAIID